MCASKPLAVRGQRQAHHPAVTGHGECGGGGLADAAVATRDDDPHVLTLSAWGVHDDADARQAYDGACDIPAVGAEAVGDHSPHQRAGDEDTAVRRQHPTEVRVGLKRGDKP